MAGQVARMEAKRNMETIKSLWAEHGAVSFLASRPSSVVLRKTLLHTVSSLYQEAYVSIIIHCMQNGTG
jgi:hypothetical protein